MKTCEKCNKPNHTVNFKVCLPCLNKEVKIHTKKPIVGLSLIGRAAR